MWRIILHAEREPAEQAAALWSDAVLPEALAVSIFEDADKDCWRVDALYDEQREARAALDLISDEDRLLTSVCRLPDEDWVAMSLSELTPVRAGRFIVHGQHHDGPSGADDIGILIEAGQAFGTGHHGTTRGCLEAIDTLGRARAYRNALDVGCGTGVLAMAIAKHMRIPVMAGDMDPIAIETAKANAHVNACADEIAFTVASGTRCTAIRDQAPYDLVVANILMQPLIDLAEEISTTVAPKGTVVLSGLLTDQEERVLAAYTPLGLSVKDRTRIEGWSTLVLDAA